MSELSLSPYSDRPSESGGYRATILGPMLLLSHDTQPRENLPRCLATPTEHRTMLGAHATGRSRVGPVSPVTL